MMNTTYTLTRGIAGITVKTAWPARATLHHADGSTRPMPPCGLLSHALLDLPAGECYLTLSYADGSRVVVPPFELGRVRHERQCTPK